MIINVNDREVEIKYSFRAIIIYEKMMNESFQPKGFTELLVFFYSTILASSNGIDLTFEEFIDYADENPNIVNEFNKWLVTMFERNGYIARNDENGEVIDPKKD